MIRWAWFSDLNSMCVVGLGSGPWQPWLDQDYFNRAPRTFKENFEATCGFITTYVLGEWQEMYVGITGRLALPSDEHPHQTNRWNAPGFGHSLKYHKMILLYVSPSAKKSVWDGAGRMEDDLIKYFRDLGGRLQNQRRGGGGASKEPGPKFTYLAVR